MAGERHEHLAGEEGKIALHAWRGHDSITDPDTDTAGVGWILAENWWPYQRPTFVTPPFAGYVSGHSTYSRAAADVMTLLTGDEYFPGGMGEFYCPQNRPEVRRDHCGGVAPGVGADRHGRPRSRHRRYPKRHRPDQSHRRAEAKR